MYCLGLQAVQRRPWNGLRSCDMLQSIGSRSRIALSSCYIARYRFWKDGQTMSYITSSSRLYRVNVNKRVEPTSKIMRESHHFGRDRAVERRVAMQSHVQVTNWPPRPP